MSTSPIEFLGDAPVHEVPTTEYGGADGVVQPERADVLASAPEAEGGHRLDADTRRAVSERSVIAGRAARAPLVGSEQTTGESLTGEVVTDPVSGRVLPEPWADKVDGDGDGAGLSDLIPQ